MNQELLKIELELDKHHNYMNNLMLGYESVISVLTLKREVNPLPSEESAYSALVSCAGSYLGDGAPVHIDAMPATLGELSTESFKLRVKAVASTVWKAISEAASKLKRLMGNWYNKLKEMLLGSSNEDPIEALVKAVKEAETILGEYGHKPGDVIDSDELEKIREAHPDTEFFIDADGKAMGYIDLERDMLKDRERNSDFNTILSNLSVNGDVRNIYVNIKEALTKVTAFNNDKYLEGVYVYLRNMSNISNKKELDSFLDNDLGLTEKAYMEMIKILDAKQGRDTNSHVTGEIIGGNYFVIEKSKKGNMYFPKVKIEKSKVKKIDADVQLTMAQLVDINRMADNLLGEVNNAHKTFDLLMGTIEELTSGDGSNLAQVASAVKEHASARDESQVQAITNELKALNVIATGWSSTSTSIAKICTDIKISSSALVDKATANVYMRGNQRKARYANKGMRSKNRK